LVEGGWELGKLHRELKFVPFSRSKRNCFWFFKNFNPHPDQAAFFHLVLYAQGPKDLGMERSISNLRTLLGKGFEIPEVEDSFGILLGVASNLARCQDKLGDLLHVTFLLYLCSSINQGLEELAQRALMY